MTTFTVLNRHGEVQTQNASLSEAAQTVLWHDGHDYEFRADGDWLELWVTPFSRNSQLGGRPLVRAADMRAPLSSQKEMAEDAAAKRHEERLILPSISVNPEESSVTVSLKSFAAFLRSFSSRVTVTLATRTILVPNVSLKN